MTFEIIVKEWARPVPWAGLPWLATVVPDMSRPLFYYQGTGATREDAWCEAWSAIEILCHRMRGRSPWADR